MEDGKLGLAGLLETRTFTSGHSVSPFKVVTSSHCFSLMIIKNPKMEGRRSHLCVKRTFVGPAILLCSHVSLFSGLRML